MPLSNLHTNCSLDPSALSYEGERNFLLKVAENDSLGVSPFPWTVFRLGHKRLSTGAGDGDDVLLGDEALMALAYRSADCLRQRNRFIDRSPQ
jgi:hypothetical protein